MMIVPKIVFIWVTLLLLQTTGKVQSIKFIIVSSQDSPCPGEFTGDPCLTLFQYSRLINPEPVSSDVTLELQPGIHRVEVNTRFSVSGLNSLMMTGTNVSFVCYRPFQNSGQNFGFTLTSIADVHIRGINFTNCRESEITSVDNLVMQDCSFHASSLRLQTVNATVVQTSFERSESRVFTLSGTSLRLEKCRFDNNNEVIYALSNVPSSLVVMSCSFTENDRDVIRFVGGTLVSIRNSTFIRNNDGSLNINDVNSLLVSDTTFEGNNRARTRFSSFRRAAVFVENPIDSIVFLRCNLTNNSASDEGAAVRIHYNRRSSSTNVSFTECNFIGNSATRGSGGAVSFYISVIPPSLNISFTECNLTGNSASTFGGAVSISTDVRYIRTSINMALNFVECNFVNNSASSHAGGLYISTYSNIPISLSKCNFIGNQGIDNFYNRGTQAGGAVYISFTSRATAVLPISLSECKFSNNVVDNKGGALFLQVANSLILITHSCFTDNRLGRTTLGNYGGAVYVSGGDNQLYVNGGAFVNNRVVEGGGSALYSTGQRTSISFVDVLFSDNSASSRNRNFYGGAVYVSSGDNLISINGGAFVNNRIAGGGGGALYSTGKRTVFSFVDVLFQNNSAAFCGVLEIEKLFHDSVNFTSSTFTNNRAIGPGMAPNDILYKGGGVICTRNASVSVANSTFSNNSAVGNAGVMHIEGSSVEIVDSEFKHNEATLDGGVAYTKLLPNTFTIHRSTFLDNRAGDDGGAMYMGTAGSCVDVNESSFSLNHATDRGGAFVILGSALNIAESSFNDNTATRGDIINACISEINADNYVFETNLNSRTACISYNNRPILPTKETATTRSMVRRTASIVMPPQTIVPQTTPDYVMVETTTDAPSRVSTTLASTIVTNAMAETTQESVSTMHMDTASQIRQEPTTNLPTESSTKILNPEESTTTVAAEFEISTMSEKKTSTTSPQSESLSMATESSDTTGFQTKASTTVALQKTEEVHTTTLSQTEIATSTNVRYTTQADTTSFSEISTKGPQTKVTSTPMDTQHPITTEEAATDKLSSSTDNELSTTNTLKGNNNSAGIVLVHTNLLITSVALALFSSLAS